MERKNKQLEKEKARNLEDYEPGATREEVLAALRKAINTPPKKPSESSAPASSKTSAPHRSDAST